MAPKRKRPRVCKGWTRKFNLGNADNLYITLNIDDDGILFEVFIRKGKAGTLENCYCEALARVISLALRYGAEPAEVAKQLRGLSDSMPVWESNNESAMALLSTPHCVSVAIDEWLKSKESNDEQFKSGK